MSRLRVRPAGPLHGRGQVPGDKSICHRALLFGALAEGSSEISGFLPSSDCLATLSCLQALGVELERRGDTTVTVHGLGLHGLREPAGPLHCRRSGTTMRLLAGILVGQPFSSTLTGDAQLLRRPMQRVVDPLRCMGAQIEATGGRAPLTIVGGPLRGCEHTLTVASAQVKSALLLAGLYADGCTSIHQPGPARDHSERMLAAMGAPIQVDGLSVSISPCSALAPLGLQVPGDISSAAFPLVAATLVPGSEVTVEAVGINPTRTGLLQVMRSMGADLPVAHRCEVANEPLADVTARASTLRAVDVYGDTVVRMIDEFPVFAVLATQAHGTTTVRGASELRVKESDRIASVVSELRKLGAQIEARQDGFVVHGPTPLRGAVTHSHGDHRLAMALTVAGLIAHGESVVEDATCIADSFPAFVPWMRTLGVDCD